MVGSRTLTALVGLLGSLAASALLYAYTGSVLFFLFVPFVPFLFSGRDGDGGTIYECPDCAFETRTPEFEYCPRDGTRLRER